MWHRQSALNRSGGRWRRWPAIGLSAAVCALILALAPGGNAANQSPSGAAEVARRAKEALQLADGELSLVRVHQALDEASATIELQIDGQACTVSAEPVSQRAAEYQLLVQNADGSLNPVQPQLSASYRGRVVEHPDSEAALTVTSQGVTGAIRLGDGEWRWIEPVQARVPGAPQSMHVIYRSDDVQMMAATCGVEGNELRPNMVPIAAGGNGAVEGSGGNGNPPIMPAVGVCTAQLAIDCDFEYFQAYGSVAAVEARINAIINAVNLQYENEVGITHQITAIIVRAAEPDPYSSFDAMTLLQQLRTQWNNHHGSVQRDLVQLFTGKNLNGSTIGLAYVGVVCDTPFAYSLVQSDFSSNFACVTDLTAHEFGHNWNAVHCACNDPPYTMNPSAVCANTFHPTLTVPEITAYRNSIGCLSCGPLFTGGLNLAGGSTGDQYGRALAFANDVNNDGEREFIVGIPFNDENALNAGKVQLHDGATGVVIWSRMGSAAGDRFGWSVASVGNRVVIGAPHQDARGPDAGRIYICDAATGALVATRRGQMAGDRFGFSLSGGGDVNNDGKGDLIVGAPDHDEAGSNAGAAYIYKGDAWVLHKKLNGENAGDRFGTSVTFLGCVNSDAHHDLAIGAPGNDQRATNAGKAYVYSGKTFAQVFTKTGAAAGDRFGYAVAGPGRMNSDGRADLVIAAPLANPAGRVDAGSVYAYSGANGSLLWKRHGATAGDRFGWSIAPAGDPNGDGKADVIIGSPRNDVAGTNAGRAFVVSGATGLNLQVLSGESGGDQFALAVAGRGARNNPETARLLVAAPLNDANAANAGRVYRFQSVATMQTMNPPIGAPPCACDVAGDDGVIDAADLIVVLQSLALCPDPCPPSCAGDVNGDCLIDAHDVIAVLNAWGACE